MNEDCPRSCNDHPKFQAIKYTLEESAHSVKHRASIVRVDSEHNGIVFDPLQSEDESETFAADDTENEGAVVDLVKWRFRFFDDDVKRLMRQLTKKMKSFTSAYS